MTDEELKKQQVPGLRTGFSPPGRQRDRETSGSGLLKMSETGGAGGSTSVEKSRHAIPARAPSNHDL